MMQAAPVRKRRRSSDVDGQDREVEPADKVCYCGQIKLQSISMLT